MPDLTKTRGYHALIQVIYELRTDGQYSDDEGEETDALADLVAAIECGREKSGAVSDIRDRLLAALERAVKAETELRVLKDSAGAAQVPAWSVSQAEQDAMSADQWDAWKAALKAGSTASVPDGWKLVPVEPTEAMLEAAGNTEEIYNEWGEDLYVKNTEEVYQAMLAAAPDAPKDAP